PCGVFGAVARHGPPGGAAGDRARVRAPPGLPECGVPPGWLARRHRSAPGPARLCGLCRFPAAEPATEAFPVATGRVRRVRRAHDGDADPVLLSFPGPAPAGLSLESTGGGPSP